MIKKVNIFLIILVSILSLFSSCGYENESTFTHYISSEPATLDPQTAKDENSKLIVANTFQGLTKENENGETVLDLAESFEYHPANKTYEFRLKEDLRWANGEPLTSHDFVFAFERIFDSKTGAEDVELYFCIKNSRSVYNGEAEIGSLGVRAPDDRTLTFELEYNYHGFMELLSRPLAMPCNEEFFLQTKGKYGLEYDMVLSNGPLTVYAWYHDEAVYLKKNSYNIESKAAPEALSLIISDSYSSSDLFLEGSNDVLLTESVLTGKHGSDIYSKRLYGLLFNNDDELFSNVNLRKALSLSFNRDSMKESLPSGYSLNYDYFATVSDSYEYDVVSAKEYLNEAYAELGISKIPNPKIICRKDDLCSESLMFALQYWQESLNIYFVVEALDENSFDDAINNREYSVAFTDFSLSDDKMSMVHKLSSMLENEVIKASVSDYYVCESEETAHIIRDNAFKALADEVVLVPVCNSEKYIYYKKDIEGIEFSAENSYIKFTNAKR